MIARAKQNFWSDWIARRTGQNEKKCAACGDPFKPGVKQLSKKKLIRFCSGCAQKGASRTKRGEHG